MDEHHRQNHPMSGLCPNETLDNRRIMTGLGPKRTFAPCECKMPGFSKTRHSNSGLADPLKLDDADSPVALTMRANET